MSKLSPIYRLAGMGVVILLTGCTAHETVYHETDRGSHAYAVHAYLQEQEKRRLANNICYVDEEQRGAEVLNLADCAPSGSLERRAYETVEEWTDRIHKCLCANRDKIAILREQMDAASEEEHTKSMQIQKFIATNEQLRGQQQKVKQQLEKEHVYDGVSNAPSAPFTVYMVQKGDTLYSIARRFYNDPHKVKEIISWNQGWIRNPDELIAGLGLVLFFEGAAEKGPQVVDRYLRQVESGEKNKSISQIQTK